MVSFAMSNKTGKQLMGSMREGGRREEDGRQIIKLSGSLILWLIRHTFLLSSILFIFFKKYTGEEKQPII